MKRSRLTDEQIIGILGEQESGMKTADESRLRVRRLRDASVQNKTT